MQIPAADIIVCQLSPDMANPGVTKLLRFPPWQILQRIFSCQIGQMKKFIKKEIIYPHKFFFNEFSESLSELSLSFVIYIVTQSGVGILSFQQ